MHSFTVKTINDTIIMYCCKCGLTFELNENSYRPTWRYVAFTDADGDEFDLSPMPTCVEIDEASGKSE